MKKEDFFRAIGEVDDAQVLEANQPPAKRRRLLPRLAPLAACLLLLIGAAAAWPRLYPPVRTPLPQSGQTQPALPQGDQEPVSSDGVGPKQDAPTYSYGVTITPFDPEGQRREDQKGTAEDVASSASMDLAWLTPEELLAWDTYIFRGTVEAMEYYTVDAIGSLGGWFTVAEVRISEILRGDLTVGDTCRVLLPVVRGCFSTSIAGALEDIEVGSEAIFMPRPATPETGVQEDSRYFCYADAADAYFSEGIRFIFLQTEDGLQFERNVYEGIRDAQTLDEVAVYIREMLD